MDDSVESKKEIDVTNEQDDVDDSPPPVITVDAIPVRTQIRQQVFPYLPPPVVKAIHTVDPILEPYVGPEPTVTLTSTLLLSLLIWQLVKALGNFAGRGRAIVDEDEEDVIATSTKQKQAQYSDTVLLCGALGAGKTRLFYALQGRQEVETVTSLRANVGYLTLDHGVAVRVMDYPGHASWQSPQLQSILPQVSRFVLVVDSTQPVAPTADVLNHILEYYSHSNNNSQPPMIFVACHKVDLPNAKNWRRIKIQLRTELERLLKLSNEMTWWPPGKPLDLDQLDLQISFVSTSCQEMESITNFCRTGQVPTTNNKKKPQIQRV